MTWSSGRLVAEGLAQAGNRPVNQVGTPPQSWTLLGGEECDTLSIARPLVQPLVLGLVTDIESPIRLEVGMATVLILAFRAATT